MSRDVAAACLIVLALLPFTAPFSTCTFVDIVGGRAPVCHRACGGDVAVASDRTRAVSDTAVASRQRADAAPVSVGNPLVAQSATSSVHEIVVTRTSVDPARLRLILRI